MDKKILIMIPAYNEQANILRTLGDISAHCPEMDALVINDCSRDRTLEILQGSGVHYLNLFNNLGIGGAVQAGYIYARDNGYDVAIQFDGDGQHEAAYLRELAAPVMAGEADVAVGSRFIKKEGFQSSGARRAGIHILSGLIHALCGVRVLDVTSGMRAVNRRFICEYAEHYAQDYPEPEALLDAGMKGARILEVPVQMREREGGESSISPFKGIYYMIKVSLALLFGRMIHRKEGKRS